MVLCAAQSSWVSAETFKILGTRPLGMGGAHVAVAEGGMAQYWNPAGLGIENGGFHFEVPVGAGVELTKDLLKEADDLGDLADSIDAIQSKTGANALDLTEYEDFLKAITEIQDLNADGLGVLANVQGGVNVRVKRFAVSLNNFTEVGADPFVDTVNVALNGGDFGADGINAVADFNGGGIGGNDISAVLAADPNADTTLANVINALSTQVGIDLASLGTTPANAANELIAQAAANGQTPAQIVAAINQIDTLSGEAAPFLPSVSGGNSFENNETKLQLRGTAIGEAAFGYGMPMPFVGHLPVLNHLLVGANLKYMQGYVGYAQINALDDSAEFDDLIKDYDNNQKKSVNVGLDLGAMLDMKETFLKSRFGLVMKNVNKPTFDQPEAGKQAGEPDVALNPQIRGGAAFFPFSWMVLAADLDLTNNGTMLPGYNSRQASLGAEFNIINQSWLNLALRAGLMKNIAESSSGLAYTGGFGLNIFHVYIELGAAVSSKTQEIKDGDKFPTAAQVAASLAFKF